MLAALRAITTSAAAMTLQVDSVYPGTAVARMLASRERVRSLAPEELNGEWEAVRKRLLWAAGLKDLQNAAPGQGYTGHAFSECLPARP